MFQVVTGRIPFVHSIRALHSKAASKTSEKTSIKLLAVLVLLGGLLGAVQVSAQTTRYVDSVLGSDTGTCEPATSPCQTIQFAINQASALDTIDISAGTYQEQVVVNKSGSVEFQVG